MNKTEISNNNPEKELIKDKSTTDDKNKPISVKNARIMGLLPFVK